MTVASLKTGRKTSISKTIFLLKNGVLLFANTNIKSN